jgi:hypothetical protein
MTTRAFTSIFDTRFWCDVFCYFGDKRIASAKFDLTELMREQGALGATREQGPCSHTLHILFRRGIGGSMETPRKGSTAVEAGDAVERAVEDWESGCRERVWW